MSARCLGQLWSSGWGRRWLREFSLRVPPGMPQNFVESSRDPAFLSPPSLQDWLPVDHLAWFVIDAVDEIELSAFFAADRADGLGRAAYDCVRAVRSAEGSAWLDFGVSCGQACR